MALVTRTVPFVSFTPSFWHCSPRTANNRLRRRTVILNFMQCARTRSVVVAAMLSLLSLQSARAYAPSCAQGARTFLPCEVSFQLQANDLPASVDVYRHEVLNVEFRSPSHKTHLIRAFSDDGKTLHVRYSPGEPGAWTYHVSGTVKRLSDQEGSFSVADSTLPGFVAVANVRHWWTTNKQPHLWLSATVPASAQPMSTFESWLDARKHDGFTHVRFVLLSTGGEVTGEPLASDGMPNAAYFNSLDDRILAAATRGFALDLVLADAAYAKAGPLSNYDTRDPLLRFLVARYGSLDVAWEGFEHFEDVPGGRALLKNISDSLNNYDVFQHPRSTDARDSSSPLLADGWMNFLVEASPDPALGAVEHQFTEKPEIHVVRATDPETFRHELWNCTTNGEYPEIAAAALENAANVRAIEVWAHIMADTRHWELEPYFEVDHARAVGLTEVEYLGYAQTPGIVEITLPKHKYNPVWVNPATGEEIALKDYRGEVFSQPTPGGAHDWILQVPREGHKLSMLRSYRFESEDPPVQDPELDAAKTPFEIADPSGDAIPAIAPPLYAIKLTRANRATRDIQYVWWGEIVAGNDGQRLLGLGPKGTFQMPASLQQPGAALNVRLLAINANGKAYELDRVYRLTQ